MNSAKNKVSMCLFGGALLSAGVSAPATADIGIDGTITQTENYIGADFGAGTIAYAYGIQTVDTLDFTVLSDGQIQLDILSWESTANWIDSVIYLYNNDGMPLSFANYIATNDDMVNLGDDLNNSTNRSDSFIDIFLPAGDYTVGIATFLSDMDDPEVGFGFGLVYGHGGNGIPTIGNYHLDIFGNVVVTGACPADLTGDGTLDFFDVSAFLTAFSTGDPVADFTGDGTFDFFDVSAFLTAFGAGCP